MSADLAVVQKTEVVERDRFSVHFDERQRQIILDTCFNGAKPKEAQALMAIAEARGMNPLRQECWFVERGGKWAVQASIDWFRMRAEATGEYMGQDEPEYEYNKDGSIKLARVRMYRKGWERPIVGIAHFSEFNAGSPTWKKMPHVMIAKCAEAIAFRKGFPAHFAKVYIAEEMDQAEIAVQQKPKLAAPAIDEAASKALSEAISVKMAAATTSKELEAAVQEATNSKPKLSREHQKAIAKVMVEAQERLLKPSETPAEEVRAEVVP